MVKRLSNGEEDDKDSSCEKRWLRIDLMACSLSCSHPKLSRMQ
jgi:hypothetical protein